MHQRTRFHAFLVWPCLALSLLAQSPEATPAPGAKVAETRGQLVRIAPHASRWAYPKEIAVTPETQIHYVEKGDTLWDLGTKYLGNPFAWPQIWELNKWVLDPHWIYPGDPLLVDGSRGALPQGANKDVTYEEARDLQPDLKRATKLVRDEYAYTFQDFIQMPFLAPLGAEAYAKKLSALKIVGRQDPTKEMQGDGDVVYVNGGANQGFKAGDRLVAFKVQSRKFYHPDDRNHRRPMGDILQQAGVMRITRTYPNQAIALVERSLDGLLSGFYAASFTEPANLVTSLRTDIAEPVQVRQPSAKIIYVRENKTVAGAGDMVIIDQGAAAGLKVGELLLLTRSSVLDPGSHSAKDVTNLYLGQAVVVRTEEKTATCRLLRSKGEILVGDALTR